MTEVSIIGAGVVGLCVANELLARNVKVSIYDKKTEAGPHACSWWAGGMLAPFCESESAEEEVCRFGQEAAAVVQTNERDKQRVIGCSFIETARILIASDGLPPITIGWWRKYS